MLDLAVPRDVEQEVGQLEDVFLFTVDGPRRDRARRRRDAAGRGRASRSDHRDARSGVHAVARTAQRSAVDSPSAHARPTRYGESSWSARQKMLARGDDPAAVLDAMSQALTNKFIHGPTRALTHAWAGDRTTGRRACCLAFYGH